MEDLLKEFKQVYDKKGHGPYHFRSQIKYLAALAKHYHQVGADNSDWVHLLKSHALYNSAGVRDKANAEKWSREAFLVQKSYWGKTVPHISLSFEQQKEITDCMKSELTKVRVNARKELDYITSNFIRFDCDSKNLDSENNKNLFENFMTLMEKVSKDCSKGMVRVFNLVMDKAVGIIGQPPCTFCTAALGSLARGEASPYSDLEFMFLVAEKSPEIVAYFEHLAVTVYFLVGNLQETKLRYMGIKEIFDWFEDVATNGLKIDGLNPWAGNIPTGNGSDKQHNHLLRTVDELVSDYEKVYNKPDPAEAKRGDITAMLTSTVFIYGDKSLLETFISRTQSLPLCPDREKANNKMMENDNEKHNFYPDPSLSRTRNVKGDIYRYSSMLIINLGIIHRIGKTSFAAITELLNRNLLSASMAFSLRFTFSCALYIRLSAYLYHKSQNERISALLSNPHDRQSTDQWHIPRPLLIHMMLHLMQLKDATENDLLSSEIEKVETTFQYSLAFALVSLYCGDIQLSYDALKKLDPNRIITNVDACYVRALSAKYLGFCDEAEAMMMQAVVFFQKTDHPLLVASYSLLAGICTGQGKYEKAMEYHKLSLDLISSMKHYALPDPIGCAPLEVNCYIEKGSTYQSQGQFDKAEECYAKAIKASPNDAESLMVANHHLGQSYFEREKYDAAETLYLASLDICFKTYGRSANSHDISLLYTKLSFLYSAWRKFHKAVEYGTKAVEMAGNLSSGRGSVAFAESLSCLGVAYLQKQEPHKAVTHLQRSLEMVQSVLRQTHHKSIAVCLENLGRAHLALGDFDKAEACYKKALVMAQELFKSSDPPFKAQCHHNLGSLYLRKRNFKKAEKHFTASLGMRRRLSEHANDPKVARCCFNLGTVYKELKEYDKAETYYITALRMMEELYKGSYHPQLSLCCLALNHCYRLTLRFGCAFHYSLKGLRIVLNQHQFDLTRPEVQSHYESLADIFLLVQSYLLTYRYIHM